MGISLDLVELADIAKPLPLVHEILRQNPTLPLPVPLDQLAMAAGIVDIGPLTTDGLEGMLIANAVKSTGVILVNQKTRPQRQRFTLGHELGHYLLPWHRKKSGQSQQFQCSKDDMMAKSAKPTDRRLSWEVQANEFASEILMPTPLFKPRLNATGEPDMGKLIQLSDAFDASKEATARKFIDMHDYPVAMIFVHNNTIRYALKGPEFSHTLDAKKGAAVPPQSRCRDAAGTDTLGAMYSVDPAIWVNEEDGGSSPEELFEQTLHQQDGYKMVLLYACGEAEE